MVAITNLMIHEPSKAIYPKGNLMFLVFAPSPNFITMSYSSRAARRAYVFGG